MNYAAQIEKNRKKLACIVNCWLILAYFCRLKRNMLPLRISAFVAELLFKVEAATGFLLMVTYADHPNALRENATFYAAARAVREGRYSNAYCGSKCLHVTDIITRLKALRLALKRVQRGNAKRLQQVDLRIVTRLAPTQTRKVKPICDAATDFIYPQPLTIALNGQFACTRAPPPHLAANFMTKRNFAFTIGAKALVLECAKMRLLLAPTFKLGNT